MPGTDAALAYGLMHVLIRDGLVDRDYVDRYTVGYDALAARAAEWTPAARRRHLRHRGRAGRARGPPVRDDAAGGDPRQLRHAASRRRRERGARGRVPAGAGRRLARSRRRRAALVVGHLPAGLRGAGAARPRARHAAHDQHVDDRRCADERASRRCARSSSTTAIPSRSHRTRRRSCRASPARTCSSSSTTCSRPTPPTMRTCCCRRPRSSSSSTCTIPTATSTCRSTNRPIAPLGEALPNTELFRRLAARMGFDEPCFRDSDEAIARAALGRARPEARGHRPRPAAATTASRGSTCPLRYAPFAQGGFPTPSGKCEFHSPAALAAQARTPLPAVILPRESAQTEPGARPALSARAHLAAVAQLPQLVVRQPAGLRRGSRRAGAADPPGRRRVARHRRRRRRSARSTIAAPSSHAPR